MPKLAYVFSQILDGSLRENWEARVTFIDLLLICDEEGVVDMTPESICGRTGLPLEIIKRGLEYLAKPDANSRSTEEEGRRIVLVDPVRNWGWRIVNYAKYDEIRRQIEAKNTKAEQMRGYRARKQTVLVLESGEKTINPRARNEIFDAIAEREGGADNVTPQIAANIGAVAATIKKVTPNVTADEIRRRYANLELHFPYAAVTCNSLAKHWARCATPPKQPELIPTSRDRESEIRRLQEQIDTHPANPNWRKYRPDQVTQEQTNELTALKHKLKTLKSS